MKKSQTITKDDLEQVVAKLDQSLTTRLSSKIDGAISSVRHDIKDLVQHFNQSQIAQNKYFEKTLQQELREQLQDHHDSLIEAISEVVIKDRIEPLEIRVGILESKKI